MLVSLCVRVCVRVSTRVVVACYRCRATSGATRSSPSVARARIPDARLGLGIGQPMPSPLTPLSRQRSATGSLARCPSRGWAVGSAYARTHAGASRLRCFETRPCSTQRMRQACRKRSPFRRLTGLALTWTIRWSGAVGMATRSLAHSFDTAAQVQSPQCRQASLPYDAALHCRETPGLQP